MDEANYGRLCAVSTNLFLVHILYVLALILSQAYFSAASELHSTQIKALMSIYLGFVKRSPEDEGEHGTIYPCVTRSLW